MNNGELEIPFEDKSEPVVFFSAGAAIDDVTAVFSAGFVDVPDAATSRLLWLFDDGWAADDVPDDFIVAVDYSKKSNQIVALGRSGLTRIYGGVGKKISFDETAGIYDEILIDGVSDRGVMSRVRSIDGEFFACGWGSQIYKFQNGSWIDLLGDSHDFGRIAFLDINGVSNDDVYAIGMDGVILHFNGKVWSRLDSPTNINLFAIDVMSDGCVFICGAEGVLLFGDWRGLRFIGDGLGGNLWDVAIFENKAYVVSPESPTGLLEQDGVWSPVDFEVVDRPTTHRLCKNSDVFWSVGEYDLLKYVCGRWVRVICPENEK